MRRADEQGRNLFVQTLRAAKPRHFQNLLLSKYPKYSYPYLTFPPQSLATVAQVNLFVNEPTLKFIILGASKNFGSK